MAFCNKVLTAALLPAALVYSHAQSVQTQASVEVTTPREPLIAGQEGRSHESIPLEQVRPLLADKEAALRTDASIDIQTRGGAGVQSDITMRGSTFEQVLVLLNGLRVNDAETSHFNLDVPVPLFALADIAVLHGSGSALFGSDAIAGAVDLRTVRPARTSLLLRAGFGSYGTQEQAVSAALVRPHLSSLLAGERNFSTGFLPDRDYRSESLLNETRTQTRLGETDLLLAGSDRAYGADQFYGNYASWERTKSWFAAVTQTFPENTTLSVAFRRHTDWFILQRSRPLLYQNNHVDGSWQAVLRHTFTLRPHAVLLTGIDNNLDGIASNNLGRHGRNRSAGYVDLQWQRGRWWLSAATREEGIGGYGLVSSPAVSTAYGLTKRLTTRASAGRGFRQPTYVDLYYSDPTTAANPGLRPETAWTFDGGFDWSPVDTVRLSATGFHSRQTDAIDYIRTGQTGRYQAENLSHVGLTGAELSMRVQTARYGQVRLSYTDVFGVQSALGNAQSRYLANYPTHNGSAEWTGIAHNVSMRMRIGALQRIGRDPYATLDIAATRLTGRVLPYLRVTNTTNTGYEEISNVRMQGRTFVGGVALRLGGETR